MIIEEKDFRLESVSDASPFFDLELLRTINKGKEKERQQFKLESYGITLDNAIKRIAQYRISNKYQDSINLETYFKEYKAEIENLVKLYEKID